MTYRALRRMVNALSATPALLAWARTVHALPDLEGLEGALALAATYVDTSLVAGAALAGLPVAFTRRHTKVR